MPRVDAEPSEADSQATPRAAAPAAKISRRDYFVVERFDLFERRSAEAALLCGRHCPRRKPRRVQGRGLSLLLLLLLFVFSSSSR